MEEMPTAGPPRQEDQAPQETGTTSSAATSGSAPATTNLCPGQRRPARLVDRSSRLWRLPLQT